jgi:hypothetical protein
MTLQLLQAWLIQLGYLMMVSDPAIQNYLPKMNLGFVCYPVFNFSWDGYRTSFNCLSILVVMVDLAHEALFGQSLHS